MGKKRSAGEGSIWKAGSSWRGQIMDGFQEDGKKKIINFRGATRSEVLEQIRTFQNQKDQNIHLDKSMTVSDWGDVWYEDHRSQVQPSTYSGYKYTLKLVKDYFKKTLLCDVLPIHVNRFLDYLVKKGYSMSQIRKCRTMLVQIFNSADDNGLVLRNPALRAKSMKGLSKTVGEKRIKEAFTPEEVKEMMDNLPPTLLGNSIRILLVSGLRVQELLALTPDDIAQDGSSISVNKAVQMVDGLPVLGPPKSEKSNRIVPIPSDFWEYTLFLREHGTGDYIWSPPKKEGLYSVGTFRRRFHGALKELGTVRGLTPHCCRHTYITQLQAKGVSMVTIAKLAGHDDIETTEQYLHQSLRTLTSAVEVLNGGRVL